MSQPVRHWRFSALVVAAGLLAGCNVPAPRAPGPGIPSIPARVSVRTGGRIVSVPLEDYVLGSALAEVTPLNETPRTVARIYEVQAVLARTYAASHVGRHRADGFDLCDGTHCQLYAPSRIATSRFSQVAREAVRQTAGTVLTYSQRPVEALFHADCGGYTAGAEAVWGGPAVPYLLPAPDDVPAAAHRSWKLSLTAEELRTALNADSRSRLGGRLSTLEVSTRDVSGRAVQVVLIGERRVPVRGEDFRAMLNQQLGDRALQSTRYAVTKLGDSYLFEGQGLGHGVGLCQLGAAARARRGDSLAAILGAYFKGANLHRPSATWTVQN